MSLPLVAIVGAPNVGKSTLFNRLVGRRRAIVTDEPGVTRDRLLGEVRSTSPPFALADTGGLTPRTAVPLAGEIERQARSAMEAAAVILFVVDARAGATTLDRDVAEMLRRGGARPILVGNKIDTEAAEPLVHELLELGLGAAVPVSAEHGLGIPELLVRIRTELASAPAVEPPAADAGPAPLNVAIVGRPNVGKSSLLNRLAGEERAVVSEIAGTTRDSVDTLLVIDERRYRLIDTAGMRRPGRAGERVERFSVARARQNVAGCDVAVLVLDAAEGLVAQDTHVAGHVLEQYKPMVVAVNKWDLIEGREEEARNWEQTVRERLKFAREVPMVLISALTGQRVTRLLEWADRLHAAGGIEVPTPDLNRCLQEVGGARRTASGPRFYYAAQTGVRPPTFVVFCNDPRRVHFSLRRRLANAIRDRYGYGGVPLRLRFRRRRESGA